jgi:hypothetical protein
VVDFQPLFYLVSLVHGLSLSARTGVVDDLSRRSYPQEKSPKLLAPGPYQWILIKMVGTHSAEKRRPRHFSGRKM